MSILDEVSIGISYIDTPQFPPRTHAIYHLTAFEDVQTFALKIQQHRVDRLVGQETQISATRPDGLGFRFEFMAREMEIDLLLAEEEGMPLQIHHY